MKLLLPFFKLPTPNNSKRRRKELQNKEKSNLE
jgi:hypothetical protein